MRTEWKVKSELQRERWRIKDKRHRKRMVEKYAG